MDKFVFFELDYIYFFYSLSLIFLGIVSVLFFKAQRKNFFWIFLSLFAFISSIHESSHLFKIQEASNLNFILVLSSIIANFCFFEFARRYLSTLQIKLKPLKIYSVIIVIFIIVFLFKNIAGVLTASGFCFGFLGSLALAYVLKKNSFIFPAVCFFLYAFSFLVPVHLFTHSLYQTNFLDNFFIATFFTKLFAGILVFCISFIFLFQWSLQEINEVNKNRRHYKVLFLLGVFLIVVLGWIFTSFIGEKFKHNFEENLINIAKTASAAVNPRRIENLQANSSDIYKDDFIRLSEQMRFIRESNPNCRFVYLMVMRNSQVLFLADGEKPDSPDYSNPGDPYTEASESLKKVFIDGKSIIDGPSVDRWGEWLSAIVPIYNLERTKITAVFGIDVAADKWMAFIRGYRLLTIVFVFGIFLFFVILFLNIAVINNSKIKLIESESIFKSLFDSAPDAILVFDLKNLTVFTANKFCLELLGYVKEEIVGIHVYKIITADIDKFEKDLEKIKNKGIAEFFNYSVTKKNGTGILVDITASFIYYQGHEAILVMARDCTDRMLQETKVKIFISQQKAILDNIPHIAWLKDKNGRYTLINEQFSKIIGRSVESIVGKNDFDLWTRKEAQQFYEDDSIVIKTRKRNFTEVQMLDYTGNPIWLERIVSPVYNDLNEVVGTVGISINITQRKLTENQLKVIQYSIDHVNDFIFWVQKNGNIFYANCSACEVLEFDMNEITFISIFDIERDLTKDQWDESWSNLINDKNKTRETLFYSKLGNKIEVEISSTYLEVNGIEYNCMFIRDTRDRRINEENLKFTRFSVDKASIGIVWIKEDSSFLFVNEAICRMLGFSQEEMLKKRLIDLDVQISKNNWAQNWQLVKQSHQGLIFESQMVAKDGAVIPVEINVNYLEFGGNAYQCAFVSDITIRKNAESLIKESFEFLQTVVDAIPIPVFYKDRNAVYLGCNEAFSKLFGFSKTEIIGSTVYNIAPKELAEEYHSKDIMIMENGINLIYENKARNAQGEYRDISFHKTAFFDKKGKVAGLVGAMFDITERKKTENDLKTAYDNLAFNEKELQKTFDKVIKSHEELLETQKKLVQSGKLAAIGQLAAGIAHEINNPLSFVRSNITTLNKYVEDFNQLLRVFTSLKELVKVKNFEETKSLINQIDELEKEMDFDFTIQDIDKLIRESNEGVERISKIILDLKNFSTSDKGHMLPVDINKIIDSVLNIVWNEIKYKVELTKDYEANCIVKGSAQQLGQVFINILVNAAQAIKDRGAINIETYHEDNYVVIEITDTGEGITSENLKKLFEPFFTTKDVGKGTGLGLSISFDIIRQHAGTIDVVSQVGEGTKFVIKLPVLNT